MKSRRFRASTTVGLAFGATVVAVIFVAGIASAGFFAIVYVGGTLVSDGGDCELSKDIYVEGAYRPDNQHDATIYWKLDIGDWIQATTTGYGLNGDVLFGFTMNQYPYTDSILYLWGDETLGSDGYWHCHNAP